MSKKYLVTSALPYINGVKHLGNLAGSLLPADVYTRFLRQTGEDVLFISATDDHGTPAEIAAKEAGLDVAEFCDIQHARQKEIYSRFGLSFDHFGRTSRPQNIELTQAFARAILNRGFAEIKSMRQIFSVDDNRFLPDRYVIGTCPECGSQNARGDQCENCTKVLDPEELLNPRSAISGSTNLEIRETDHLFLKLSKLSGELRSWVDGQTEWPGLVTSIAHKWLDEGLQDRCITRDLKWGVPADIEGLEGKVFYVWFDAPIGYISATKEWADLQPEDRSWKDYWYDADNVEYVQFMAKDNIPFHTLSFPATEIATGEPWKKVDYLKGFNWLNYYGQKFSTSKKYGIFTEEALEILPPDYWRYYLTARSPEGSDSTFTWQDFQAVVNKDLADVYGNFTNRILKFAESRFEGHIPMAGEWTEVEQSYADRLQGLVDDYSGHMEKINMRKAVESLRKIWVLGNEYITESAPWTVIKTDPERAGAITNYGFNVMRLMVILSRPVIPFTSEILANALNIDMNGWVKEAAKELRSIEGGDKFKNPGLLFKKLEDDEIAGLEARFSGNTPKTFTAQELTL